MSSHGPRVARREDDGATASSTRPRPTVGRRILRGLLWALALLVVLVLITASGLVFLVEIPVLIATGWIRFLRETVASVEFNPLLLAEGVLVTLGAGLLAHWLATWLHGALAPAGAQRWRVRWTVLGLVGLLLLFVAGIATIGLSHQVAWLAARTDPILWDPFSIRARVYDAINQSNPHRTSLAIACEEGTLAGADHESLALSPPAEYGTRLARSVLAEGRDAQSATVTITFRDYGKVIREGSTVVYTGTCRDGAMSWAVHSDLPARVRPRI